MGELKGVAVSLQLNRKIEYYSHDKNYNNINIF